MQEPKIFKVIVAGGRYFNDFKKLESFCKHILKNQTNIEIVSGTAEGADALGEQFAINNNLGLKSFPAPWDSIEGKPESQIGVTKAGKKYWKPAGHFRNKQMADYANALIAFHDGKSKGTAGMISLAKSSKLKVAIYKY